MKLIIEYKAEFKNNKKVNLLFKFFLLWLKKLENAKKNLISITDETNYAKFLNMSFNYIYIVRYGTFFSLT